MRRRPHIVLAGLAALALLAATACSASIGDSCQSSTDCSTDGTRVCDTSFPGGYCTIAGCTADSCPSEAACVEFFPGAFLTTPCNPATENAPPGSNPPPTHDCLSGEICLPEGLCAPQADEQRFCMFRCGSNADCRSGYVCRETGYNGAESVPSAGQPTPPPIKFCAPAP